MRLRTILKESIATGGGGGVPLDFRATLVQWALVKRRWDDAEALIPHSPISTAMRELITSLGIHPLNVALVLNDPATVPTVDAAVVADAVLEDPERITPLALERCLVSREGEIQNAILCQFQALVGLGPEKIEAFLLSLTGDELGLWEAIAPNDREPTLRMDIQALLAHLDEERLIALCYNPDTPEGVLYSLLGTDIQLDARINAAQRLIHARDLCEPNDVQYLSPEETVWMYEYVTSELAAHCTVEQEEHFIAVLQQGCDRCSEQRKCADAIQHMDGAGAPPTPRRNVRKPGSPSPAPQLPDVAVADGIGGVSLETIYEAVTAPGDVYDQWRREVTTVLREALGTNARAWDRFWDWEFAPDTTLNEAVTVLQAPLFADA